MEIQRLLKRLYRSTSEKIAPTSSCSPSKALKTPERKRPWSRPRNLPQPAKPRRKRKGHGRFALPEHLPRELVRHELDGEARLCPCCGDPMAEIGHDACEQLDIIPATLRVIRHEKAKYACSHSVCKAEPEATVHTAERPDEPIAKCKAKPGTLAAVAVDSQRSCSGPATPLPGTTCSR